MKKNNIPLKMLSSLEEGTVLLENSIKNLSKKGKELIILEAGCGHEWPLNLAEINYKIIGVDLDEVALNFRINDQKDLDEAIVADLHKFDLGGRQVDVIYNSFVLEHLEDAALVLENFSNLLKPGGILILTLPDRNTVFGFVTRITPFWFHVFFKKYLQGYKDAGKPGCPPYPTYYNQVVSREGIREFCKSHGFSIDQEFGICGYLQKRVKGTALVRIVSVIISIMSFGKLPWNYNILTYALTKTKVTNKTSSNMSSNLAVK